MQNGPGLLCVTAALSDWRTWFIGSASWWDKPTVCVSVLRITLWPCMMWWTLSGSMITIKTRRFSDESSTRWRNCSSHTRESSWRTALYELTQHVHTHNFTWIKTALCFLNRLTFFFNRWTQSVMVLRSCYLVSCDMKMGSIWMRLLWSLPLKEKPSVQVTQTPDGGDTSRDNRLSFAQHLCCVVSQRSLSWPQPSSPHVTMVLSPRSRG